ncbi:MAG: DNA polymerase III subunit alpha [Stappiaceae bacterium]
MSEPTFVHLRVHSAYSLLEGALQLPKIVELAKADSQPAVCIADTGNLFGALEFSDKAYGAGIQPIIGCQLSVDFGDEFLGRKEDEGFSDLVLIAASDEGAANLTEIVSRSYTESEAGSRPHITLQTLRDRSNGLITLTGGIGGPIGRALSVNRPDLARKRLKTLQEMFGDRLYQELQRHHVAAENLIEADLIDLAYENGLPLVATNEPFFPARDDFEAHDALICIAEGRMIIEDDRRQLTEEHYFKTQAEMVDLFSDLPEAIENTLEIARRCHTRMLKRDPILPRFTGGDGDTEKAEQVETAELRRQAQEGLRQRLDFHGPADGLTEEDYQERLEYELGIIERMKFPGYFLIVADFIKWAKLQDIPVGPGRGSGAGSLVAYSLTITDLDPLRFALLFERFLNPDRVSMPDFDIDFCQDRREEVIRYVQDKYGRDQVAQIITFGTMQARIVLRDVGRVLQMPYGQVDRLCKMVPNAPGSNMKLAEAIAEEPRLQEARAAEHVVDRLMNISLRLEGLNRHAGTHAAGIVIGDRPLEQLVPIYRDPRSDMPVTQYNMKWVEQAGLVKFDFLGLKTLTTIDVATKLIAERGVKVDIGAVPIEDKPTYDMLARGETVGVFQLESAGMRRAIAGMRPDRFEDIIALVALYRPGPMDNIPVYNRRKHGQEKPDYMHPKLEPVLRETYGIIVYQEQVMELAQLLAGYSLGEADLLRRAMGKKIAAEMEVQRGRFAEGAKENGVSKSDATMIFDVVAKFANYGFNKSHAAAYALVAYHTAWLKANHPVEFMAASMTLDMGNTDKLNDFRQEAQRMGIDVVPPSINRSGADFRVRDGKIIYAMAAIKGVGEQVVEHIVEVRGDEPFKDLGDFARRINARQANRRTLENLICAGAFDELDRNRARLIDGLDRIIGEAQRTDQNEASGQADIFGSLSAAEPLRLNDTPSWLAAEQLQREHQAIGFYLSAHPLDEYRPILKEMRVQMWSDFADAVKQGASAGRLAGTVTSRQERKTRSGNKMGIIRFSDPTGQYEAIIFAEGLGQYREALEPGKSVVLLVGAEMREEDIGVRIQSVEPLDKASSRLKKNLRIFLRNSDPADSVRRHLKAQGEGDVSLILLLDQGEREVELKLPGRYQVTPQVAGALKAIPGVLEVEMA